MLDRRNTFEVLASWLTLVRQPECKATRWSAVLMAALRGCGAKRALYAPPPPPRAGLRRPLRRQQHPPAQKGAARSAAPRKRPAAGCAAATALPVRGAAFCRPAAVGKRSSGFLKILGGSKRHAVALRDRRLVGTDLPTGRRAVTGWEGKRGLGMLTSFQPIASFCLGILRFQPRVWTQRRGGEPLLLAPQASGLNAEPMYGMPSTGGWRTRVRLQFWWKTLA